MELHLTLAQFPAFRIILSETFHKNRALEMFFPVRMIFPARKMVFDLNVLPAQVIWSRYSVPLAQSILSSKNKLDEALCAEKLPQKTQLNNEKNSYLTVSIMI